jgi:mitochondrial inner membrane protein COX18
MRSLQATQLAPYCRLRTGTFSRAPFQQIRSFHPTRKTLFISEILDFSSGFLHGMHSVTGLPWVASIPLASFVVRMVVGMPLQVYSRIHARREHDITPLLQSWQKYYQDQVLARRISKEAPLSPWEAQAFVAKHTSAKHMTLRKKWKVSRFWKLGHFLQIPVWLSIMESLRAMCGNDRGLVPYLLSLLEPSSTGEDRPLHLLVEPSLASEGALWFPDLLAGDTTGILPMVLCLSILLNISQGWKTPTLRELADYPTAHLRRQILFRLLKGLVQAMAINVGITSYIYGMPSGLMIYWITSSNIATLQSSLLDQYMFANPPLKPWMKKYVGLLSSGETKPTFKSP